MQQRDPEHHPAPVNPFENLTEEERLVLVECRRNSVARGIPLAVLAGFLSSRLIPLSRASFLTNYAWQWSLAAGIVSYFWGVRSYQNVCMDKLMHLEHSNIADLKRKTIAMKQQHNIPLNSWEQKWASEQAYRLSLDDNIPHHVAEMSDTYKGQEPYTAQSDTVMFAPSQPSEPKQSEKPRRRTFEEIRAEHRKLRAHTNQDPSHLRRDDDDNTVGEPQTTQRNIKKRPRRNQYGDIIYDDE